MEQKITGTTKTTGNHQKYILLGKNVQFFRLTRIHDDRDHPSHFNCLNNMEPKTPGTTKNYWKPPKISPFWEKNYFDLQNYMTTENLHILFTAETT